MSNFKGKSPSDASARSLFSWPPSPVLTAFQITARGALLLNSTIGIGLCFAAGAEEDIASDYVGGSFMVVSWLILPFLLCWNVRMLRKSSSDRKRGYEQLESEESQDVPKKSPRIGILKFAVFIDLLGFLSFLIVYPITVTDAEQSWWHTSVLMVYASVACLIAFFIHFLLLLTQLLQLRSARKARAASILRCPNCDHTLQRVGCSSFPVATGANAEPSQKPLTLLSQESLVDADDNITVVNMEPGQETGTTIRTPRMSSSAEAQYQRSRSGSSTANETGESEGDRLIEKSQ